MHRHPRPGLIRTTDALQQLAAAPSRTALLTDFDGTLAPIVDDPAAAAVLPAARDALAGLVGRVGRVAVVSGRPVAFLQRALGVPGVTLAGLYGLERATADGVVVDERALPYLEAVATAAGELDEGLPDLLVERKGGVAVTVHWRRHPDREVEAIAVVDEIAARHGLVAHAGRRARELRPPVPVDKGAVVAELAAGHVVACFAGDDAGDIPAFVALDALVAAGELGAAIRIGVRSGEAPPELLERADVVVDGPDGLAALFDELRLALPR